MYLSDLAKLENTNPNPASKFELKRADSASDSANGSSVTRDTVDDRNYDVMNSYNFVLRVEGFQNLPLKAVRGINKQNEYEYIQEGGLNDYVHMVRKQISQPFTFQVERYVAQDWLKDAIDPLANGTELILPLVLYMYRSNAHDGTGPSRFYIFTNCRVTGVQVGELDAEKSGLHTITNTIAYAQMTIVTVPFVGIDDDSKYKFNNNNSENKSNTSHVRTLKDMGYTRMDAPSPKEGQTQEEVEIEAAELNYRGFRTKDEMKLLRNKYAFKNGSGNAANSENLDNTIVQNQENSTKKIMEGKSRRYKFNPQSGKDSGGKTAAANNENSEWVTGQNQEGFSKTDMEEKAAEGRYQISWDGKTPNKVNTNSIPDPEKPQVSKDDMENKAKGKKYRFKDRNKPNAENKNAIPQENTSKDEMKDKAKKYSVRTGRNGSAVKDELEINKTAMQAMAEQYNMSSHHVEQPNEPAEIRNGYSFGDGPTDNVASQENQAAEVRNSYKFGDGPTDNVVSQENQAAEVRNSYKYGDKPTDNVATQENEAAKARNDYKYGKGPTQNVALPKDQLSKKQMEGNARKYPATRSARDVSEFLGNRRR